MEQHMEVDAHNNASKVKRSKYLIFNLASERYAIPLSVVKEVIGVTDITPIPHAPDVFKGLINLRGQIHSVLDLRIKLNLTVSDFQRMKSSIIIVEMNGFITGVIVDDVNEVAQFNNEEIEQDLTLPKAIKDEYISGVAKNNQGLVILLDVDRILNEQELRMLKQKLAA